jgi:hypothetical protein
VVFFSHYRNASFSEPTFRSERALGRITGKESGSERPPLFISQRPKTSTYSLVISKKYDPKILIGFALHRLVHRLRARGVAQSGQRICFGYRGP